ncbi:type II toxin-antitoxin system CcdA family antitoxin [Alterisphingorhabdus coralli]|uniref:Type II toxin-antitoxin system CcdA family antitoxin n=1 Tax=Alterisphingorhabdus coralli TaxID=3071408 RepID=A0AA97F592_9SPHN|nr:type II toxin-antitoxin system CcdA family antitoxin [Parasphingorhabdus sp. SCSIO 66989]WOE74251.1 type II toxin-antitoxin system CcdA family antitoxin [Parasphingorhabdus sp. SCSIO 66989]
MRMKHSTPRKATNITLDPVAVDEAKQLGINVSQACENGLRSEIAKAKGEQWLEENREAIDAFNEWIAENGLPLEEHRQF